MAQAVSAPALIIFDCDGVLIDSEVIACRVDAECFARIGISITADDIMARYVGTSAAVMFADIERRFARQLPPDFAATLNANLAAAFDTELAAIPGVEIALQACSCRCVASSSAPDRLRHSLRVTGLLRYFDPHLFSATQVPRGKPAPDLFLFAARSMNARPADCLVIEDSVAGIAAARIAGMQVFGFCGGSHCGNGHGERLRAAGANLVFSDMRQLPRLLASAASRSA